MKREKSISEKEYSFLKEYYHQQYDKDSQMELIDLILKYENEHDFKEKMMGLMNNESGKEDADELNIDQQLDRLHHKINLNPTSYKQTARKRFINAYRRYAAILILPLIVASLVAGYFINQFNTYGTTQAVVSINAASGAKTNFTLPDGTKGWLNSNSTLSYKQGFKGGRKVTLIGEAYFDVVHNSRSPFWVDANDIEVKVLGTKFDVINYPAEDHIEVILEEGKVECTSANSKELLKPNQQLVYSKEKRDIEIQEVTASHYTSWRDGLLILRDGTLEELIKRLSRAYDVEIEVKDEKLNGFTFWGSFRNEKPEEIFDLLRITSPIRYDVVSRQQTTDNTFSKQKIRLYYDENWEPVN